MSENRVFSEQEAADLVLAAVKLQEASATSNHEYTPGITYTELLKIAKDVGVSEDYLRQAMQEQIAPGAPPNRKKFLGWPLSYTFERVLDVELPPDSFDVIADEITTPGVTGAPAILGRTITGMAYEKTSQSQIKVSSRNGRTRIENKINSYASVIPMITVWFILPFMLIGIREGSLRSVILSLLSSFIVFLITYIWPQHLANKHMKLGEERVERIAKKILDEVQSSEALSRERLSRASPAHSIESDAIRVENHE